MQKMIADGALNETIAIRSLLHKMTVWMTDESGR
jgi:hypothetical protein